ncbi:MAG: hypothetical protein KDA45_05590, partial [Planctomycetales bacterium]|nr:hypothetical protein [Planctomycetales bacterium]
EACPCAGRSAHFQTRPSHRTWAMSKTILESWNQYWFAPRATAATTLPRVCICSVAGLWLASFLPQLDTWLGPTGFLSRSLAAKLIDFENTARWQNWSPLWLGDSTLLLQLWLLLGIGLALLSAVGIGGRLSLGLLLFWIVSWAHRIVWMQGPLEPALIACVAYLIVQPGDKLWSVGRAQADSPQLTWTSSTARRLLQTHWWILVAAGLLSQLASLTWWRGEAVWWLASAGRSQLFTVESLRGQPTLVNALTHGMVLLEMLALWCITLPAARGMGIVLGLAVAALVGLVADHVLYALLLAACLTAYVGGGEQEIVKNP